MRAGFFRVSKDFLHRWSCHIDTMEKDFPEVLDFFSKVIVYHVQDKFEDDTKIYYGFSRLFDEVEDGALIPEYEIRYYSLLECPICGGRDFSDMACKACGDEGPFANVAGYEISKIVREEIKEKRFHKKHEFHV